MSLVDLTIQTPVRGYFQPNEEMLAKTQAFLRAVRDFCNSKGIRAEVHQTSTYAYQLIVRHEVYQFHNDGNTTHITFLGHTR